MHQINPIPELLSITAALDAESQPSNPKTPKESPDLPNEHKNLPDKSGNFVPSKQKAGSFADALELMDMLAEANGLKKKNNDKGARAKNATTNNNRKETTNSLY